MANLSMKKPAFQGAVNPSTLPAGDARREAQAVATEELARAAESLVPEAGAIDPHAFQVENEIASQFNELQVPDALPDRAYCWEWIGGGGTHIRRKEAEGWTVVQGDDQEARSLKGIGADTTRRLGDVLLMWMPRERYERVLRARDARRAQREGSPTAGLDAIAEDLRRRGVKVNVYSEMIGDPRALFSARAAQQMADKQFADMIRTGTVPGAPAPR